VDCFIIIYFYATAKGNLCSSNGGYSKRELGEALLDDLEWLGFEWDEGPRIGGPESTYWQSERQEYYANILESLALEKLIYPCFCNRARLQSIASAPHVGEVVHRYDGHCRHIDEEKVKTLSAEKDVALIHRFL